MVDIALENYPKLKPSKIEFDLPQPSYTVNTLAYVKEKHSDHTFSLIMGEDNLKSFHKWKNHETILENHNIYVYPRISKGVIETQFDNHPKIHKVDAPIVEISSTFIRKSIKIQSNIRPLLPHNVWQYLDEMNFYKK
jgi:nicotinate-nucleotide adenylyltransferase